MDSIERNERGLPEVQGACTISDTTPEPEFDRITRLAAAHCGAPIAVVWLLRQDRTYCKSAFGLSPRETDFSRFFCLQAVESSAALIVPDAAKDSRFAQSVLAAPHIRFYAGVPLITSGGGVVGTLAVMDHVPRSLDALQLETLRTLAQQALMLLELRRMEREACERARAYAESQERFKHLSDMSSDWYWEQDSEYRFTLITRNPVSELLFPAVGSLGKARWELPYIGVSEKRWARHRAVLNARRPFSDFELARRDLKGEIRYVTVSGVPVFDAEGNFKGYRGIGRDITERKQVELARRKSKNLLRQLASRSDQIKEDERKRIAREIHDELGQNLVALRIELCLAGSSAEDNPKTRARMAEAVRKIDATMDSVNAIMNNLRPFLLDVGLDAAIEWHIENFQSHSGVTCDLQWEVGDEALPERVAITLFRIVQESLTNVMRHARATLVQIKLHQANGYLKMQISDDGVGFGPDQQRKPSSFGLLGMKERVKALKGKFKISSKPGEGTSLHVAIPLQAPEGARRRNPAAEGKANPAPPFP